MLKTIIVAVIEYFVKLFLEKGKEVSHAKDIQQANEIRSKLSDNDVLNRLHSKYSRVL